jgi:hypothetical protein
MKKVIILSVIALFISVVLQPAFANNINIGIEKQQPFNDTFMKSFGGKKLDEGFYVQQTSDGGYIITGETHSYGAGEGDVLLLKTDRPWFKDVAQDLRRTIFRL